MNEATIQNKNQSTLITTGFALFSMFFGAGNLIFPLLIGKTMGSHAWFAILGLTLTAVIVPFIGLATMVLFQADYVRFFSRLGKTPGFLLLLLLQLILGPFGVIPRLITLMHAMSKPYLAEMPIGTFSLLSAALIFVCSFNKERLIKLLGVVLTPVLLLSLAALIFFGVTGGSSLNPFPPSGETCFLEGLFGGYNTMDLIASFLFATVILPHFKMENQERGQKSLLKKIFYCSLIAASLLFFSYAGLCLISAHHGWTLSADIPPEQMLGAIAFKILGPFGGTIAALAVITACLTTAITLSSIFASYLRTDLLKNKISPNIALMGTLLITALFANLGFEGIAAFLGPLLQIVYPGLIVLTVMNLLYALYGYERVKLPVFLTFALSALHYLVKI